MVQGRPVTFTVAGRFRAFGPRTYGESMYDDLPPDLPRLRAIRTYLEQQLKRVDQQIGEVEAREQSPLARPATAWWLQHLPPADGGRGRGVLHRDGCWAMPKQRFHLHPLSRDDAVLAVGKVSRDEIELCDVCHPERDLKAP